MVYILFLVLFGSAILGYRVISKVPPLLHTPLMSGMNALSGITIVGAITVIKTAPASSHGWAAAAIVLATINVVGGFWVTERMLRMFKDQKNTLKEEIPWH